MVCYHPDKSCDHKHYDSGDIRFLICQVTSRECMFKLLCEFVDGSSSQRVTTLSCSVAIGLVQVETKNI